MDRKLKKDPPSFPESQLSNQKNYEDLFNSLNDAATLFVMRENGLPGRYLEVNDTLCRWLGYTREELLKLSPLDISEKVDDTVNSEVAGTFAKKGKSVIERTLIAKDGRRIPVEVNFHLITYEGKKAVLSISRDVSERNSAEAALRESEEKFRTVIEQNLEGFSLLNETGTVLEWNSALESITGIKHDEAVGKALWDVQVMMRPTKHRTSERYEKSKQRVLKSLQTADSFLTGKIFESEIFKTDGTPVTIQQLIFPVKTKNSFRLASVTRDITAYKKVEEALRESEELFRRMFEQVSIGMALSNQQFFFSRANKAFCDMFGYTEQELSGMTFKDITHPEHIKTDIDNVMKLVKGEIPIYKTEKRYVCKNGSVLCGDLTLSVLRDSEGRFLHVLIIIENITQRKKSEEALNKAEKLESIGILAGGIAHDFNNLLTGIFGYIDVARLYNASGASDKVTMNLSKALEVFNRARALTQQLLTFSKGGAPVKKALPLTPLLTSTTNFVLSGSTINARFSFSNDLWPCEVDENQLGQVIDNIIINARQAMPTGGSVVLTAENIPDGYPIPAPLAPGNYVRISIRDFGIGIAKEHLPHIFDPFFTTKQEGSGLGLATVYSIIRKHEGMVEVESELGIGTTFHIYLPAVPSARTEQLFTGIKKHRGQGVVLVMDDEEFVRDVAMELLRTMGYAVEPAKNGEEAVDKYKRAFSSPTQYAFVILDLTIPGGMGGRETVQELLKINPSVSAIASSGYSQDPVMTDPKAFGFKDKIRKPFTKEELGEVLERVTGNKK